MPNSNMLVTAGYLSFLLSKFDDDGLADTPSNKVSAQDEDLGALGSRR